QPRDDASDVAILRDPGVDQLAVADRFVDHILERAIRDRRDGDRQRAAENTLGLGGSLEEYAEPHLVEELCFGSAVEHLETRRHIGLEWKLMQHACAKGMDGLHLEAARRVERERKQPPRPRAQ